ncbi:site-specific tyrosine recombinase/integron integrase [Flavicella marina]|uniref:site-specific tyrosine recombinase/integron integrase n=1 Tax=Flavicella marina TaxID=1475951 RepID=UPI001265714A|nr:site-specific tyrosine recombinase/integron integrase [Flavicella marina]
MKNLNDTPLLTLKKVVHREHAVLLVEFKYNFKLKELIKSIEGFRFSYTLKGWVALFTIERLALVIDKTKDLVLLVEDSSLQTDVSILKRNKISAENNYQIILGFKKYLIGKRYSESTVSVYTQFVKDFINYQKNKRIEDLVNRDVELFLEDVFIKKNMSISTQRQFISAMKHFVVYYPQCSIDSMELVRPKKDRYLPTVLSQEEVIDLIRSCKNLKHRAIITLLYSSGLRIGELLSLKLSDINIDRKQIYIKNGKGRKDRYVQLAKSFLPLLRNYVMTYRPSVYFVEGQNGKQYTASSVRKFLHRAVKEAEIEKKVTPHTLRHSYATHMLENGIGLRHIQSLLGHAKPETTMIYTHVAKKDLLEIESPLDNLILSLRKTDKDDPKLLLSQNNYKKRGL